MPADPRRLEEQVRQLLADKISGNQVGIWLLVPEYLRLGVWDLLLSWTGQPTARLEPRLGLHLVNEAALCLCSFRHGRTLSQKGFEVANGLPFVPSDQTIHDLLEAHTVLEAEQLQIRLGQLRRAGGHFAGQLLALDPHRLLSYTQRQMRRHRFSATEKAAKMSQTFFLFDCQTQQPLCFTLGSSAQTVTPATLHLLELAEQILRPPGANGLKPLVLADKEHYCQELFAGVGQQGRFDLLCAESQFPSLRHRWAQLPAAAWVEPWPGYATTTQDYYFKEAPHTRYYELIQRNGVAAADYQFQGFLSSRRSPEVPTLTRDYPARWNVEEFFKVNQALGWQRAGTLNLNVRYGQMSLALVAQAAIHQLRQRLGPPYDQWDATHFARHLFQGLEGDLRVSNDTILVTYYNAPNAALLAQHYAELPAKLQAAGVAPEVPWLFNFKLDFRFK